MTAVDVKSSDRDHAPPPSPTESRTAAIVVLMAGSKATL